MLNKINYLETEAERYPLVFTLNVMEASLIQREGEPDIKALKFFMTEAINEGIEIENEKTDAKRKPISSKQVGRILTEVGISDTANKIMSTITDSVDDCEEKNSKCPQKE